MVVPTKELHGYGTRAWLRKVAKHEGGHALMLWLLDQYLAGIYICENGGVTMRVAFPDRKMTHPSQHLLYTIAGMVMTYDHDVIDDLRAHVDTPEYFAKETDSYAAAMLVRCFKANPFGVLLFHDAAAMRLRIRFRRQYNELLDMLFKDENHTLDFKRLHELFGKWDREAGFDKRPKSDLVMRSLKRMFKWRTPRCKWLGWDLKPLDNWKYSPPSLMDVALQVKDDMEHGRGRMDFQVNNNTLTEKEKCQSN